MSAEQNYKLANAARQRQFDELLARMNPSDLRQELAACRMTIQDLLTEEKPSPGLVSSLLTVCAKLAASHQVIQERSNEVIGRNELGVIVRQIMDAVADNLQDLPDFHSRMDRIVAALADLRRPVAAPKVLTLEAQQ